MRVLVTGHDGFLGAVVAPVLMEAGHDVVGLDAGRFTPPRFGPERPRPPSMKLDVREVRRDHLAGFDAVVHLAAISSDAAGAADEGETWNVNHRATVDLAREARAAGVGRFVFLSTCSVYGAAGDQLVDESAPRRPLTAYAATKAGVEDDLHALADGSFSPVLLRAATAYGVSPRLRLDVVVNNLAARAHLHGRVEVLSDGRAWRGLVHVEDLAAAVAASLAAPRSAVHDEAFNVGSENVQIGSLARVVADVMGCEVEVTGERGADPVSYRVDFSKVSRHLPDLRLGWDARRGVEQLADAFRRYGLTDDDLDRLARRS